MHHSALVSHLGSSTTLFCCKLPTKRQHGHAGTACGWLEPVLQAGQYGRLEQDSRCVVIERSEASADSIIYSVYILNRCGR